MKYIKTYEGPKTPFNTNLKNKFIKLENEPYKSFFINNLYKECKLNDIDLLSLIKEIILNKKITFQCGWCYDEKLEDDMGILNNSHNVIGTCIDVRHEDESDYASDILIKIKGENLWHTLFVQYTKNNYKYKVRVYNYEEGPLMNKLNILKDTNKYNL